MYGQIIAFLFVLLILYYVVMIFLDIQKAKAEIAAELEKNKEEVIDISDEAGQFQPVMISRYEPKKKETETHEVSEPEKEETTDEELQLEDIAKDKQDSDKSEPDPKPEEPKKVYIHNLDAMPKVKPTVPTPEPVEDEDDDVELSQQTQNRPANYRAPIMTDCYDIPNLLHKVDQLAESGDGPLASVIYKARNPA